MGQPSRGAQVALPEVVAVGVPGVAKTAAKIAADAKTAAKAAETFARGASVANAASNAGNLLRQDNQSTMGGGDPRVAKVSNMKQFFQSSDFASSLWKKSIKLNHTYKGAKVYKVNIEVNEFIKKGYHFYIDTLHYDHLEVFNKHGKAKFVLNLDGTLNKAKTAVALREARNLSL